MRELIERHRRFWSGEGPCLLLVPPGEAAPYDTQDYDRLFADPRLMWESEMRRARAIVGWPTDGIPTVRPNLGVIFVPSIAGQGYAVKSDQMPWPGDPLPFDRIRAARGADAAGAELMRRAEAFYLVHRESGVDDVVAYHADTQGVFDVAHLLYGDEIFTAMAGDEDEQRRVLEVMDVALDLYVRATRRIKEILGEPAGSMIHGHGSPQGIFFPEGGARVSEDTPTLLSPAMIDRFVMPYVERSLEPFSGGFAHFCGRHPALFERLCACPLVKAIDLGNPESYEPRRLLERCAASGTVLWSRLPSAAGESGEAFVRRIGALVRETGARVILRSTVTPRDRAEAEAMLALWRDLTG
jgi:hypothetical protein